MPLASFCKTVGFAYTGSNPVPATPAETAPGLRKQVRGRSFWEFTRYGLVVAAVTIALAVPYLWLRYLL
ncbi:hypothetical protein [Actinopolymorpha pittospori]|uniref:Uncharacterized protein n=1 Tax=Actinopolymorpha pittospori TaxID=648752 RepID=A0A927RHH6_9ACTN|nr:hypothetical protein [Actinopolymorpha pittospori]MBE1603468.1 hypothetical protein [Actinopolymorpha pittospori]